MAADEITHEHRHQRHRQPGGGGHGVGLGEGERREQPALLCLQGEYRQEADGDDEQREEQRRPDFLGRAAHDLPAILVRDRFTLEMFVHVLDHDNGRVHHGADGDGDAAERHDVGVDALAVHHDKGDQDADRQHHDGDQRRAQVEQERHAHQRDDDEFLDERAGEVADRALDDPGAVVGGDDLHAFRQALFQAIEFLLHRLDGGERVLAIAHDDDAARHLALAVQLGDAAAHLRPEANLRDLFQADRRAGGGDAERDRAQVLQALHVAAHADHVLGLGHLDHRAARFLVALLDRHAHVRQRQAVGAQLRRVDDDLVLLDHAADRGDFGDARHGTQFVFQEPILQRAQLRQVVFAAAVHQCVLVHPAHAGGVRAERRFGRARQARDHLAQILEHARARPVDVGAIRKNDIDEGIPEHRVAAHRGGARHRQHGGGERVGDLVLDRLRRLARVAGLDDDLHVGQVGDGVERRARHGVDARGHEQAGDEQHQETVVERPTDELGDHGGFPQSGLAGPSPFWERAKAKGHLARRSANEIALIPAFSPGEKVNRR